MMLRLTLFCCLLLGVAWSSPIDEPQEEAMPLPPQILDVEEIERVIEEDRRAIEEMEKRRERYFAGDVMEGSEVGSINAALQDVESVASKYQERRCMIGLANVGNRTLRKPQWFIRSHAGVIHSSPPTIIQPGMTGLMLFTKSRGLADDTAGVITYEIVNTDYKVAVMWYVPYSQIVNNNHYNTKVYHKSVPTNKQMYKQMMHHAGPFRSTGMNERNEFGVKMESTMADHSRSKLVVWVDDKNFSPKGAVHYNYGCSYHGWWVGNFCWRECTGGSVGTCWMKRRCKSAADCRRDFVCRDRCSM